MNNVDSVISVILLVTVLNFVVNLADICIIFRTTVFNTECALPFSHKGIVGLNVNGS